MYVSDDANWGLLAAAMTAAGTHVQPKELSCATRLCGWVAEEGKGRKKQRRSPKKNAYCVVGNVAGLVRRPLLLSIGRKRARQATAPAQDEDQVCLCLSCPTMANCLLPSCGLRWGRCVRPWSHSLSREDVRESIIPLAATVIPSCWSDQYCCAELTDALPSIKPSLTPGWIDNGPILCPVMEPLSASVAGRSVSRRGLGFFISSPSFL